MEQHYTILQDNLDVDFSFEEFTTARHAIDSRIFLMKIAGDNQYGLSPYCDMINHELDGKSNWGYSDERLGFGIKVSKDCAEGVEMTQNYGDKANHDFYLEYGFILDSQRANSTRVSLSLKEDTPFSNEKGELLNWRSNNWVFNRARAYLNHNDYPNGDGTARMIRVARFLAADNDRAMAHMKKMKQ